MQMSLERIVADLVQKIEHRFYGKYRGFVVDNDDKKHLGRLTLRVPSVLGNNVVTGWATPCVPYGGVADQGFLFIPEKDAGVWVEFEEVIWSFRFGWVHSGVNRGVRANYLSQTTRKERKKMTFKLRRPGR